MKWKLSAQVELGTYEAVEKKRNGEVFRKAKADGRAARANAPSDVFTMMWSVVST